MQWNFLMNYEYRSVGKQEKRNENDAEELHRSTITQYPAQCTIIAIEIVVNNVLGCPESSRRKRFKFNKCILKFKSSAFQFSFKIGTDFPDNPI